MSTEGSRWSRFCQKAMKFEKNIPLALTKQLFLLSSVKTSGIFFQIFVAFSKKLDFKEIYLNLLMWWRGRHKHVKCGHCMPMSSRSWPAKNCEGTRASAKKKGLYRWCLKLQHPSSKKLWWVSSTFHTLLFWPSILMWNPWSNRKAIICRLDSLKVALSQNMYTGGFLLTPKKKYYKSLSWAENLNKMFTVLDGKFNFSAQDGDLEYVLCFGEVKILQYLLT